MSKSVKPDHLGEALSEVLTVYGQDVTEKVNECGQTAMKTLVSRTKATAPVGARGSYKKNITSKAVTDGNGMKKFIWHVKAPDHRLTHLLVKGHAKKNGGRTRANPFLQNALDEVLPAYEEAVKEAVKG